MARKPQTIPCSPGGALGGCPAASIARGKPRVSCVGGAVVPVRSGPFGVLAGLVLAAVVGAVGPVGSVASAQLVTDQVPEEARGLEVEEKLGELARLSTKMIDSEGRTVTLDRYFNQTAEDGHAKPVILAMVYYECPLVCDLVRERLLRGLNGMGFTAGEDYNLVVVSFDSAEPYRLAAQARRFDLVAYTRDKTPEIESGFNYHVAEASEVRALGESIGFRFRLLDNGEYSHPIALTILTPDGKVARYLYGFDYPSQDVRLALLEASEGKIAESLGDQFVMFCFQFDPNSGTYTLQAWRVMQLGAIASAAGLALFVGGLLVSDRVKTLRARAESARRGMVAEKADGVGPRAPQGARIG